MLTLDRHGLLHPYELISCTIDDLRQQFVDAQAEVRQIHFQRFLEYSGALKAVLGADQLRQWVDGSFVTLEPKPNDIDFVTFIDHKEIARLGNALDTFKGTLSMKVYGVDAYILETYSADDSRRFYQQSDMAYWADLFSKTRRRRDGKQFPKGFLEILH